MFQFKGQGLASSTLFVVKHGGGGCSYSDMHLRAGIAKAAVLLHLALTEP